MKVGFTGSQLGMSDRQAKTLDILLRQNVEEFHHGDCVGADEQGHGYAFQNAILVIVHPPDNPDKRAFCKSANCEVLAEGPYIERNHDIVNATDVLIAAPSRPEYQRSGTWATVRYARKLGRPIIILDR